MHKGTLLALIAALLFSNAIEPASCQAKDKQEKSGKTKENAAKALDPASPVKLEELSNVEGLTHWMTYYYLRPQPDLFVPALLLADKLGLLTGDSAPPLQAFSSRIFAQNPEKIKDWFTQLQVMSDTGKNAMLTSIWWANCKEGKDLLASVAANLPDKAKKEFQKQIDRTAPELDQLDIESPDVLDMLWGAFSATGDERYVKRLLSTLAWAKSEESKDLSRMLIASAARWSLLSNLQQHAKLKEIFASLQSKDPALKPQIDKLLAEADASKTNEAAAPGETPSKETKMSKKKDQAAGIKDQDAVTKDQAAGIKDQDAVTKEQAAVATKDQVGETKEQSAVAKDQAGETRVEKTEIPIEEKHPPNL